MKMNQNFKKISFAIFSLLFFNQTKSFNANHLRLALSGHKDLHGFDLSYANLQGKNFTRAKRRISSI